MTIDREPCDLTVTQAGVAIAEGKLSSVQLVNSCLERIDRLEEKIQAWTLLDREGSLNAAHHLDEELHWGKRRGSLHGIPVGVKDIFYTAGLRTEAGSRLWSGFVPSYDATAVARLKEAGAIILGKTHTTEFAYFDPPPTRNPWNTDHTPGGSSSGSGAAVAAGMCPVALGSQTGGSTLRPASFNGIVGLKAEHGRISAYGVVPLSWTMDHVGILARSVEDTAIVLQILAGYDSQDPHSLSQPMSDCLASLHSQEAPRLGLLREYFFDYADDEMRHHTEEVAEHLHQAGAKVEEVALPPGFDTIGETNSIIMSVEAAAYHQEVFAKHRDQYGTKIGDMIERGLATAAIEYARALQSRLRQRVEMQPLLNKVDALLTPGAPGTAPRDLTTTGNPVMQVPWSTLGLPTIGLPTGLGQNGLPLGVQLIGASLTENHLLKVARWCERVLDVHLQPPLG